MKYVKRLNSLNILELNNGKRRVDFHLINHRFSELAKINNLNRSTYDQIHENIHWYYRSNNFRILFQHFKFYS